MAKVNYFELLPNELICYISTFVELSYLSSFIQCCRRFYNIIDFKSVVDSNTKYYQDKLTKYRYIGLDGHKIIKHGEYEEYIDDYSRYSRISGIMSNIMPFMHVKCVKSANYYMDKLHGKYYKYRINGTILTTNYYMGLLHGEYRITDSNGNLIEYISYKHGMKHGDSYKYKHNWPVEHCSYNNDILDGSYFIESPNYLRISGEYQNGLKHGKEITYYSNKIMKITKIVDAYRQGQITGYVITYDIDGYITEYLSYDSGNIIDSYVSIIKNNIYVVYYNIHKYIYNKYNIVGLIPDIGGAY